MKVGTRTCLDWNTYDFPPYPRLLEQVEQAERGLLVDGVVQLALGMQPSHALLAVAGNQRFLDRAGGTAFRARTGSSSSWVSSSHISWRPLFG